MGTVTYISGGESGDVSLGAGAVVEPDTDLPHYIDSSGRFTEDLVFQSEDGLCWLSIEQGTIGITEDDEPLNQLTIVAREGPPQPPPDATIIGLTYELGPKGASFEPPITLILSYHPSLIPEGVSEQNLLPATWDENNGEWVLLRDTL